MFLTIIGGASGVGKTSLLKLFADIKQVNTGDLFKHAMILSNRDEIKKGDWSTFEYDVISNMIYVTSNLLRTDQDLIIDTHFAAKIFGTSYRIGLKEKYLCQFGQTIFKLDLIDRLSINVILITTDPYLLLARRRLDRFRNRELVPSDCYNDLRSNDIYSHRYLSTLRIANKKINRQCKINYHLIKNEAFDSARKHLTEIIGGV